MQHMAVNPKKQKAQQLFQKGKLKQAQALYEKLCKENPRDAESFYMLGSIFGQQRKFAAAEKQFRQTLKLQPNALVAHCGLGAALKELGRFDEAATAFQAALKLKPDHIDVQLELAGIFLLQGKTEEAENLLQTILKIQPRSATALEGMGEICHLRRELQQAIDYYQRALEVDPKRTSALNRLGFVLHTQGRLDEAIAQYRKALDIDPRFADSWNNMGSSLMTAGRLDKAQQAFEKTLKISPQHTGATVNLATVFERKGEHDKAYKILAPLLKKGVQDSGLGIAFVSICSKVDRCNEAGQYLETLLREQELPENRKEYAHFSLGKLYDKLGRHDEAFRHYQSANDLRPDTFSETEHAAIMDAVIRTFDHGFLSSAPRASIETDRPVFILGMPRSGTSLTEQILARHDQVYGAGELLDIGDHAARLGKLLGPVPGFPDSLRKISREQLDDTARAYLDHLQALSPDARYVTDKMPQNFIHLGLINLLFPGARVIHCVRDPRDTCLSIYFQHFNEAHTYASKLENIAAYYLVYYRMMKHWESVLDIPMLTVRYEDMVTQQEATTRKMLEFLDLEWDDKCLDFHKSDRFVPTSSYDQVTEKIYTRSMARWEKYKDHIGPLLDKLKPIL